MTNLYAVKINTEFLIKEGSSPIDCLNKVVRMLVEDDVPHALTEDRDLLQAIVDVNDYLSLRYDFGDMDFYVIEKIIPLEDYIKLTHLLDSIEFPLAANIGNIFAGKKIVCDFYDYTIEFGLNFQFDNLEGKVTKNHKMIDIIFINLSDYSSFDEAYQELRVKLGYIVDVDIIKGLSPITREQFDYLTGIMLP